MKRIGLLLVLILGLGRAPAADAVAVGTFAFDNLIPGPDGVNTFTLVNLTGDSGDGGFALPPEFPVVTPLSFRVSGINFVFADGSVRTLSLGNIGPGPFPDPTSELQFPDITEFRSARFTAELSDTDLLLADGSLFLASSSISARLVPAIGDVLVPGADFVILEAAPQSEGIPQPGSWILLGAGMAGVCALRRVRPS